MQDSEKLRKAGLRATTQRLAVLRMFEANERSYWNAEDVHRQAMADGQHIGRATVYRTLAQLADAGILVRSILDADSGVALYKLNNSHHHDLLVCSSCKQVQELFDGALEARTRRLAASHDFELHRYQLVIYGHCAHCQSSDTPGRSSHDSGGGGALDRGRSSS